MVLLNQIGEILDEVEWMVTHSKAELSSLLLNSQEGNIVKRTSELRVNEFTTQTMNKKPYSSHNQPV